ncbi:Hypothetical protein P9515_13781 [Prochlorococcus marinus str. MIT 9515]|uniref:Oligosaccharide repeat unit polymerase n=1 Tax=Prochlorococcus marinus (strain MIT 9515) TaxID=167542 RepID=A2BXS4_PROM5|nr:Hypothetical protein P9515_13781 [Prochlorococcus marinus str. MIT 9515]
MFIDFLFSLNSSEIFYLIVLFIICIWELLKNYNDKKWFNFFKPTTLFGALVIFYCLVGPIITSGQQDGSISYRGVDHREFYEIGLIGALLTYLSFQLGFNFKKYFKKEKFGINKLKGYQLGTKDYLFIHKWGERIILFSLFLQFINYGTSLLSRALNLYTLAEISSGGGGGGFASSWISSTVNFLIVGIVLLFICLLNGIKERTKFVFYLLTTISLYVSLGFRYRLFLLLLPLILIYFFYKKIKPDITLLLSLILSTLLIFGFIQISRNYGTGLNYELFSRKYSVTEQSVLEFVLKSATFDTNVFHTSAAIIYKTPEEINYSGIKPIINTLTLPIPRILWQNKPKGEYLITAYRTIYDGFLWEVGAANLGFAEYYLAGGWIALITINFFLGLYFKKLWNEFLLNFNDPIAQIKYSLYLSFMFIVFTRGYLLQLTFLYFTIFIPFHYFSNIWNKRYR